MSTQHLFDEDRRDADRPYRVAEVNRTVKLALEQGYPDLWVEGELSDVTRSGAGHVYFTLNDEQESAQIKGVMFRSDAQRARAELRDGERVKMRGGLSLYEPRGGFQLQARLALPSGAGELRMQLRRLWRKLKAEGLLEPARKRPLPRFPRVVGIVTSAQGAALGDIVRVTRQRCPVRLVVADCRVQGEGAAESIVIALHDVQRLDPLDVIIVARGGGSTEDLWAFNDERVARAIAACRVPVVAGVGHETDLTMAELVADVRASTPSNAAELAVPDRRALAAEMATVRRALERAAAARIDRERLRIERERRRLGDPRALLGSRRRAIAERAATVGQLSRRRLSAARARLAALGARLARHDARSGLARDRRALAALSARLGPAIRPGLAERRRWLETLSAPLGRAGQRVAADRTRFAGLCGRLEAMSPLAVLARGYSIALVERTGRALRRAAEVSPGDRLELRLSEGTVSARVEPSDDA